MTWRHKLWTTDHVTGTTKDHHHEETMGTTEDAMCYQEEPLTTHRTKDSWWVMISHIDLKPARQPTYLDRLLSMSPFRGVENVMCSGSGKIISREKCDGDEGKCMWFIEGNKRWRDGWTPKFHWITYTRAAGGECSSFTSIQNELVYVSLQMQRDRFGARCGLQNCPEICPNTCSRLNGLETNVGTDFWAILFSKTCPK